MKNRVLAPLNTHDPSHYVRLAGPEAAALIEALISFASKSPLPRNLRDSARLSAEARARTCYDHLAGRLGVP